MKQLGSLYRAAIVTSAVAACATLFTSSAQAQAYREFTQVSDVADIRQARGLVFAPTCKAPIPWALRTTSAANGC